jgi:hypothetical protein
MLQNLFQTIRNFGRDPRIGEIIELQQRINSLLPNTRLGVLFRRKWGKLKVTIAFPSDFGIEHQIEFDLDTAYWYIQGVSDGMLNLSREKDLNF